MRKILLLCLLFIAAVAFAQKSTISGHSDRVYDVVFSPDSKTLASGSGDKAIKLWRVADGSLITTLSGHSGWVSSVAFSPDGKTLATGSVDKTIKLWRVADGSLITMLSGHSDGMSSVAFSPDGKTLASGSGDKTIKLWRVADRILITTLSGHSDLVYSVAFSPDGRTLASGSSDKTIKLWDFFEINSKEMARQDELSKKEMAWQAELNNKNPQSMYLRAGQYARDGDSSKANQLYDSIIKRFPDSPFAVKADDQLNAGRRAERMENEKQSAQQQMENQRAASRQQCEAQKQTCFSGCGQSSYWNGRSYVDNQSWSGCRSRCESISCY